MPEIIDITNWSIQEWYNTGGTRSKKYVQSPQGVFYYFKRSYKTQGRDYFFEFWSEVIATQVGRLLGFNMLEYIPAIYNNEMGCLSQSMINSDGEELIEGGKYLQADENKFNPDVKAARSLYSFQLIEKALGSFKLSDYIEHIIEIIIFDSLIGNGDRHQENWAFINQITSIRRSFNEMEKDVKEDGFEKFPRLLKWIISWGIDLKKREMKPQVKIAKLFMQKTKDFAPIYDSGSSLGRELTEEKVNSMLANETELTAYLNRGVSEIHWEQEKLNHFDLITKLHGSAYNEIVCKIIDRVISKYNSEKIERIITHIDDEVPLNFQQYKLNAARKRLILKMITLRFERIKSLHHERV
jgi:hypothetical protein